MPPQRIINVEQSVRVLKFLWGTFQVEPGAWIEANEGNDAGDEEDVRTFLRGEVDPPEDSVTISINRAIHCRIRFEEEI